MDRSLWAVLAGTFTLRFSTGLTGAMLSAYLAKLPEHGGPVVAATTLAALHATFYVAELVLSPLFGLLSDRLGHHRVMLFGPAFGAVAVVLTGLTTSLLLLGGTRLLEGASTAASIPSILGYIAAITAGNELLRGKAAARFEGATLAGIGVGFAAAPLLFAALGPTAFFLNAGFYGVSFLIYRYGVADHDAEERAARPADQRGPRVDWRRYGALLRSSHVWLLAPTWIAVNASIGLWFSQSIFQFSKADPRFPDQFLLRGFSPMEISLAAVVIGLLFGAGLIYWGNRFRNMRRTTIILYGILGGAVLVAGGVAINHGADLPVVVPIAGLAAAALRAVRARRRDAGRPGAPRGHLGAVPGRPRGDHGAVQRLPRDRPDRGRAGRRAGSRLAWHRRPARGHDGDADHRAPAARTAPEPGALRGRTRHGRVLRRHAARMTSERPWAPVPLARGARGAVVAPHHLATQAGLGVLRAGGSAVDAAIATNAALGVVMPSGCGIGGDAFWLTWDAATGRQGALNGSGRAGSRADAGWLRATGLTELPRHGPLTITVPGAVRSWGDAHARGRAPVAGRDPRPGHRAGTERLPGVGWVHRGGRAHGPLRGGQISAPMRGSSRCTDRTAARGDRASASACRHWHRRSSAWPTRASTPSTTATWASSRHGRWPMSGPW